MPASRAMLMSSRTLGRFFHIDFGYAFGRRTRVPGIGIVFVHVAVVAAVLPRHHTRSNSRLVHTAETCCLLLADAGGKTFHLCT